MSKTGAEILADVLESIGVKDIFCITGAGNLAIVDAIAKQSKIKINFFHHEQAAVMAAQGYSRIRKGIAVVLVTTGGGTVNALTGILSAFLDSDSILLISGNESSFHCENTHNLRAYGVQGFDSVASSKNMTKWSTRILTVSETAPKIYTGAQIAVKPRSGPVHIDFPMDLQRMRSDYETRLTVNLDSYANKGQLLDQRTDVFQRITRLTSGLMKSQRPVIYMGNGCRNNDAHQVIIEFATKFSIPIFASWSALDLIEYSNPLTIGAVGIYGNRVSNTLIQQADFLISIGTRLAIPQIGYSPSDFARQAERWFIDIDASECLKFSAFEWNTVCTDSKVFVEHLVATTEGHTLPKSNFQVWLDYARNQFLNYPMLDQCTEGNSIEEGFVHSAHVVDFLNKRAKPNSIFVTDVGAGLLTGHQMFEMREGRRILTSQGLGEMGFGLPAAIGAAIASKEQQIICLNTDGGIMFNLQELQTVITLKLPINIFIFNNLGYAMIKISQNNLFEGRKVGSDVYTGLGFPDFSSLAFAFGFAYKRISILTDLDDEFATWLSRSEAKIIEVMMDPNQRYTPRLATHKDSSGKLVSPPLEDLDPLLPIEKLESLLGGQADQSSYLARGLPYKKNLESK